MKTVFRVQKVRTHTINDIWDTIKRIGEPPPSCVSHILQIVVRLVEVAYVNVGVRVHRDGSTPADYSPTVDRTASPVTLSVGRVSKRTASGVIMACVNFVVRINSDGN